MKKFKTYGNRDSRKKLAGYTKERNETKLKLINDARTAAEDNHWPEYLWPDVNDDAWFHRKSALINLVEMRGGFSHHISLLALTDSEWETKETVASWLRRELKGLREAEMTAGASPVRRGGALSRSEISDIAIELLGCIGGESLVCLFQELLDVDRHRKSLAEDFIQLEAAADLEAQLELQDGRLGVRAFAKVLSVAPSTVTRWRKSQTFRDAVESNKQVWSMTLRDEYFDEIRRDAPTLSDTECYRRAFHLYMLRIPSRRAQQ